MDVLFPVLVLVTWVATGFAGAVYLGRHGRRSAAWYAVGFVLGPVFLPIAVEMAEPRGTLLTQTRGTDGAPAALRVLAAVDGSPEAGDAIDDAARLLGRTGAQFIFLTVLDPDQAAGDPRVRESAERLLTDLSDRLPVGARPVAQEVAVGQPVEMILDRAAADAVDLVVLGRRGRGLSRAVLGSVADAVVRRSPRPVMLGTAPPRAR